MTDAVDTQVIVISKAIVYSYYSDCEAYIVTLMADTLLCLVLRFDPPVPPLSVVWWLINICLPSRLFTESVTVILIYPFPGNP